MIVIFVIHNKRSFAFDILYYNNISKIETQEIPCPLPGFEV